MNAVRDALAHRFVAYAHDETQSWPPELQVALHRLAFTTLPELILELDAPSACRFARDWRERLAAELASPATAFSEDELAWLHTQAAGRTAMIAEAPTSSTEVSRLAELLARFGPLALSLSWRDDDIAKA